MGDILNHIVPDLFKSEKTIFDPTVAVILHGVNLPLDTPVNWAYENLSFADNFLHLVVTFKKES
jgi:autophagy-related protein 5